MVSRVVSQKWPMRLSSFDRPDLSASTVSLGSGAVAPADHGSPYMRMSRPRPGISSSAARTAFMVSTSIRPIRSKRKPSMWYSRAQNVTDSTMNRRNILRSVAISQPQPDPLASAPLGLRRRK